MVFIHVPVGQDDDVCTLLVGAVYLQKYPVDGLFQTGVLVVVDGYRSHLEARHVHVLDLQQVGVGQDGVVHLEHLAVLRLILQQIAVGTDVNAGGGDHLFPDGVNGRVRHLCEPLFEVVEQRGMLAAEHGKRGVGAHGTGGLCARPRHGKDHGVHVLVLVAEHLLQPGQLLAGVAFYLHVGDLQPAQLHQIAVDPLAVGLAAGVKLLQLFIVHHLALDGIHQQHLAGAQAFLDQNVLRVAFQNAHLRGQDHAAVLGDVVAAGA